MTTTEQRNRRLARSTLIVIFAFGAAKAISLIQTIIIAQVFGAGAEYDAFVLANRIPEQIYTLIAGGAIAFAFIPVFTGLLARDEVEEAWQTASHVINTIFSLTFVASLLAFIFAPWLVANVVAPGFNPVQQAQTVELQRIILISTVIFSVSGLMMGILQSHNSFFLPSLAPIMYDVGILFGVAVLIPLMGVHGIAWGAVIGAGMHLAIQIPGLFKVKMRWRAGLGLNDPNLHKIAKLMLPRIADLGLVTVLTLVTANILSRLGTGSASAFDWGWRLMQIPETLIGTAMGVVIFPTLSALSSIGDNTGKRDAMSGALRFILIATIPSAVGLVLVGRPLISLLERGAFDASASSLVYTTLQFFSIGIIVHSLLEIIARSFYADKDTFTPLMAAIGGSLINLVAAYGFSDVLRVNELGAYNAMVTPFTALGVTPYVGNVGGLALANTLGVAFEVVFLMWVLRHRWHGINENVLAMTTLKTIVATIGMGVVVVVVEMVWQSLGLANRGLPYTVAQLGLQVGLGAAAFVGVALLVRMNEIITLIEIILRRRKMVETLS